MVKRLSLIGIPLVLLTVSALAILPGHASDPPRIENPKIDMKGHIELVMEAAKHREGRRLTEDRFLATMREPGTIILDARARARFEELHIEGAVNLPFPEFGEPTLAEVIPNKTTRILIYCNNNFEGAERPFLTKVAPMSLNLSTFGALYAYGYRNVYELGPLLDVTTTKLPFAGTMAGQY